LGRLQRQKNTNCQGKHEFLKTLASPIKEREQARKKLVR